MDNIWKSVPQDILYYHILSKLPIDTKRKLKIKPFLFNFKTRNYKVTMHLYFSLKLSLLLKVNCIKNG
jgi:hypothetical protein